MNELNVARVDSGDIWVGVDIGGTKTAVVLSCEPPIILSRVEFPTLPEQGPHRVLQLIIQTIDQFTTSAQMTKGKLGGIGISCGGPLDRLNGVIQTPPNLPTWIDVPIASILQRKFGVNCRLENDANAGAVAEHRFGAGQGKSHMIF